MALADLTSVAQDYLKVIWARTEWGEAPITAGELAQRFGTSPAAVTDTARRLAQQGLVEYVPYRPLRLTAEGERAAVAMVRRHRLIETYLVNALGYAWDEVHEEAEQLEHAVSDRFIDRLDAALGHPREDPHGDPIPRSDGRTRLPEGAERLDRVTDPGRYEVLRVSDADPGALATARDLGALPGRWIAVETDGGLILEDGRPIPAHLAQAVRVRRAGWRARGDGRADGDRAAAPVVTRAP